MHQKKKRQAKGRGAQRVLVLNLSLVTDCNTSSYKLLIEETGIFLVSNPSQVLQAVVVAVRSTLQQFHPSPAFSHH